MIHSDSSNTIPSIIANRLKYHVRSAARTRIAGCGHCTLQFAAIWRNSRSNSLSPATFRILAITLSPTVKPIKTTEEEVDKTCKSNWNAVGRCCGLPFELWVGRAFIAINETAPWMTNGSGPCICTWPPTKTEHKSNQNDQINATWIIWGGKQNKQPIHAFSARALFLRAEKAGSELWVFTIASLARCECELCAILTFILKTESANRKTCSEQATSRLFLVIQCLVTWFRMLAIWSSDWSGYAVPRKASSSERTYDIAESLQWTCDLFIRMCRNALHQHYQWQESTERTQISRCELR